MQIMLPSQTQYYLHAEATDLRKGFDGLCGMVERVFGQSPLSDTVFIFLNRQRNRIKLLHWQGDGFAIFYKRLERGTYELPAAASGSVALTAQQLRHILEGISLASVRKRRRYAHRG